MSLTGPRARSSVTDVSTRTLIVLALLCGLAVLVAFAVQVLLVV